MEAGEGGRTDLPVKNSRHTHLRPILERITRACFTATFVDIAGKPQAISRPNNTSTTFPLPSLRLHFLLLNFNPIQRQLDTLNQRSPTWIQEIIQHLADGLPTTRQLF
jgi:hypothetical protein